jgi:hypothetical protein
LAVHPDKEDVQSLKMDVEHAERSLANAHKQLEKVEGCVDGFYSSLKSHTWIWGQGNKTNAINICCLNTELESLKLLFFNKLERNNTIVNKRLVFYEEELNKLAARMGEKMETKFKEIKVDLGEVVEEANTRCKLVEVKVVEFEDSL